MAKTKTEATKNVLDIFKKNEYRAAELKELVGKLIADLNYCQQTYTKIGEKQDRRWNSDTKEYELIWEDEEQTIPRMIGEYDYVDIPENELSEDDLVKIQAYNELLVDLQKLL